MVNKIPEVVHGMGYISTKYPSITSEKIDFVKTIEYPTFYQSTVIADSQSANAVTIVLNIDKVSKSVTEVGTYS